MYNTGLSVMADSLDMPSSVSLLSLPYEGAMFHQGSLDVFALDLGLAKRHVAAQMAAFRDENRRLNSNKPPALFFSAPEAIARAYKDHVVDDLGLGELLSFAKTEDGSVPHIRVFEKAL